MWLVGLRSTRDLPLQINFRMNIRTHSLLTEWAAAVQLHQQYHLHSLDTSGTQHSAIADSTVIPQQATDSSSYLESCHRCLALRTAVTNSDAQSSSAHAHARSLYRKALGIAPPFQTLSPNLSQLAFTVGVGRLGAVPSNGWLHLSNLLDTEGWIRWDAFTESRIDEWNAQRPPTENSASSTANVYSASSSFVEQACASVEQFVTTMTPEEFVHRYGDCFYVSSHHTMIVDLFKQFHMKCVASPASAAARTSNTYSDSTCNGLSSPLVFMILSTHIERLIGDIFCALRASPETVCPRMLRDLFLTRELSEFLPPPAMFLLQSLCGSPLSFNIRNLLWHGFIGGTCDATDRVTRKFTAMLWMIFVGLMKECTRIWLKPEQSRSDSISTLNESVHPPADHNSSSDILQSSSAVSSSPSASTCIPSKALFHRPLKTKFPGDAALFAHLSSSLFEIHSQTSATPLPGSTAVDSWPLPPSIVFDKSPSKDAAYQQLRSEFIAILSSSYFILHHRLHDLIYAFDMLRVNPYISAVLVVSLLEQLLRTAFVFTNATIPPLSSSSSASDQTPPPPPPPPPHPYMDAGLLLAQTEKLFTTMDIVLSESLQPLDEEAKYDEEGNVIVSTDIPTVISNQKCDRTSPFFFPLVAQACTFNSTRLAHNQLYLNPHPLLPATPTPQILAAIDDLLLSRLGPRLRDRVAHGEILWNDSHTIPLWLPLWSLNVLLGIAVCYPLCEMNSEGQPVLPRSFNEPLARQTQSFFTQYQSVAHARSQFMYRFDEICKGANLVEKEIIWQKSEVETESSASSTATRMSERNSSDPNVDSCDLELTSRPLEWYSFALSASLPFVQTRGLKALSGASSADSLVISSNALIVHCGILLRMLRSMEPDLPVWQYCSEWMIKSSVVHSSIGSSAAPASKMSLSCWNLAGNAYWRRSHDRFHHADATVPACHLSCIMHCFNHCMTHAPIVCIQRILEQLMLIPQSFVTSLQQLRIIGTSPDAPSAKRKLLVEVQSIVPSVVMCILLTNASMMWVMELMMSKAHHPPDEGIYLDPVTAKPSDLHSSVNVPTPLVNSLPPCDRTMQLLREDRSISRLLKKTVGSVERIRTYYVKNCFLKANSDWTVILEAIQHAVQTLQSKR